MHWLMLLWAKCVFSASTNEKESHLQKGERRRATYTVREGMLHIWKDKKWTFKNLNKWEWVPEQKAVFPDSNKQSASRSKFCSPFKMLHLCQSCLHSSPPQWSLPPLKLQRMIQAGLGFSWDRGRGPRTLS